MNTVKKPYAQSLPVLMYHYISRYPNSIAVSPELFAQHCAAMRKAGWRGISLAEAEAYLVEGTPLPAKSCLITFDDGYLDNYVHAWSILREHGHQGVIFAVTEKIEHGDVRPPHPTTEKPHVDEPFYTHPNGYTLRRDLFLNWNEARLLEAEGTLAIAAHGMSHQSVFIDGSYTEFLLPGNRGRTFDRTADAFWGQPKFPQKPGLANRAFIPDPALMARIRDLVPQDEDGAFAFAADPKKMEKLKRLVAEAGPNLGRMESDEEMAERIRLEIVNGKSIMEKELGHPVTTLCWPWGAYSPLVLRLGQEAGFRTFITTQGGANPPGSPLAVNRFKAKAKDATWLMSRLWIYSRPIIAKLYARCQL